MTSRNCQYPLLLARPAIIGAVSDLPTLRSLAKLPAVRDCDLLEFRLDAYGLGVGEWKAMVPAADTLPPALITVRDPAEGGRHDLAFEQRIAHYEAGLDWAALIDVEVRNMKASAALVDRAKGAGVLIVGSFHDFEGLPDDAALARVLQRGVDAGADAIKLAVTTSTLEDLLRLTRFFVEHRESVPLSAMGMGAWGKTSRLLLAQAGSRLNYAYLQAPNALGQWQASELRRLFAEIIPPPAPSRAAGLA